VPIEDLPSELRDMLGQTLPVLDDGFIRIIDCMGNDSSVVQAARVSYGKGTKRIHEDRGLIRYLMRNGHTTPFEMCEIKLHVRAPMDTWRQWVRHRTASVNEYSTRYSVAIDSIHATASSEWRTQAQANRQGSEGPLEFGTGEALSQREKILHELSQEIYQERLSLGVAREQARKDLPLSTYTEAYWKIDLHNLLHFLELRMDDHAQLEIREYATIIGNEIVSKWCPVVWQAFLDYRINSLTLSGPELTVANLITSGQIEQALEKAVAVGLLTKFENGTWQVTREARDTEEKFAQLGITVPWSSADARRAT
jgi:thymidylate synthase (FAD)